MKQCGVVIEVCIYVEVFEKGFIFDFGIFVYVYLFLSFEGDEDVRLDWGFGFGSIILEVYDGMIVKFIVCGDIWEWVIVKMEFVFCVYEIVGVSINVEFFK